MAKTNALKDCWNRHFSLYQVTWNFCGAIQEEEKFISKIPCYRDSLTKKQSEALVKREMILYRTKFFELGNREQVFRRTFETEEIAKANALSDQQHENFSLYQVVIRFDGIVKEKEQYLAKIPCYNEVNHSKNWYPVIPKNKRGPIFYKMVPCEEKKNSSEKMFETKELAYDAALHDSNHTDFILYQETLILDGRILVDEKYVEKFSALSQGKGTSRSLKK